VYDNPDIFVKEKAELERGKKLCGYKKNKWA
jgi:hypothetical protein